MASEQFSLCWDNFHKNMSSGMNSLLESEDLVDVTLAVEGKYLKAHKMVLSVCSPYFKELFKSNPCQHPIVFMKDVSYVAISDLLQFMYQGEVQVSQDNLTTFIKTAEALQIKGLTGDGNGSTDADSEPVEKPSTRHVEETYKPSPRPKKQLPAPVVTTTPASKRPRLSVSSNDSQSAPVPITKTEPVSTPASGGDSVQFKVEPYDQNQSVTIPDDTGDDNFGDDTLDDNLVDDNEDYSMMEGDEPQAGTSTDGTGEGQDAEIIYDDENYKPVGSRKKTPRLTSKLQFVAEGFLYHNNVISGSPPLRYLSCSELKKTGCRGRATIPLDGTIDELKVTQPHNHPPDQYAAERLEFLIELKNTVRAMEGATLKKVYEIVCEKFRTSDVVISSRLEQFLGRFSLSFIDPSIEDPLNYKQEKASYRYERPRIPLKRHGVVDLGDGYLYRNWKRLPTKIYLKCAMQKEVNCRASYVLNLNKHGGKIETFRCVIDHNHPPSELTLQSARFLAELEQAIQFMPGSTKNIFDQVIDGYPDVKAVYTYSNVVGRMHHWLKKYNVHKRGQ